MSGQADEAAGVCNDYGDSPSSGVRGLEGLRLDYFRIAWDLALRLGDAWHISYDHAWHYNHMT
jgi:hypothetical protein